MYPRLKGASSELAHLEKLNLNFSSSSFKSVSILSIQISFLFVFGLFFSFLVFSHLSEVLFSGFFNVEGALFVAKNQNWKYRDRAAIMLPYTFLQSRVWFENLTSLPLQTYFLRLVNKFSNYRDRFYFEKYVWNRHLLLWSVPFKNHATLTL